MKLIEKLAKEAHKHWVDTFAAPLAGHPMSESEKATLGRVPFGAGYEAGFRVGRELAKHTILPYLDSRFAAELTQDLNELGEEDV